MSHVNESCWEAFGSDSEDEEVNLCSSRSDSPTNNNQYTKDDIMARTVDALALAITQYFAPLIKLCGISLNDRVVAVAHTIQQDYEWTVSITARLHERGFNVVTVSSEDSTKTCAWDAAVVITSIHNSCFDENNRSSILSAHIRRSLLPGGMLWIITSGNNSPLHNLSDAVWNVGSASTTTIGSTLPIHVIKLQKRACCINSWSCPWMDKNSIIPEALGKSHLGKIIPEPGETYLQYERRVACAITIATSVAERSKGKNVSDDNVKKSMSVTLLSDTNVHKATTLLQEYGMVVIKGLLPPDQTIPWGNAALSDFQSAVERMKCHPQRPVDLLTPQNALEFDADMEESGTSKKNRLFEPLSYKEMSMREDLRVDLRSGPIMEKLRHQCNKEAFDSMRKDKCQDVSYCLNDCPTTISGDMIGTLAHWRFHPSIIKILKLLFNPKDDTLFQGNFGRWNFGGSGPNGSPQPLRMGQIGSVISCPGAGDQAIHADTPHLFEHVDCLPCHYCNVFTPGYYVSNDTSQKDVFKNEFDCDGVWTGNSTIGGTALVTNSHRLSVAAKLLSEKCHTNGDDSISETLTCRLLLQLQTIRPALDAGDVLIFDNRLLHYGLANTSRGDTSQGNHSAGRRPMLYLNVTQSWFHDPKNWDDRESIFS